MASDPEFRADLYRGTASFYDEFRLAYPETLLDDLRMRARTTGTGRLLDLACGTGQITFALAPHFAEIWAVDQEGEAVDFARAKAHRPALGVNVAAFERDLRQRLLAVEPEGVFREETSFSYMLARKQ